MIGTIRKHSAALWWIIVVAVIVTFVAWSGSTQTSISSLFSGNSQYGEVDGRPLRRDEILSAYRQVEVQDKLNRRSGASSEGRDEQAAQLAFLQRKINGMGIVADDEVLATALRESFKDPSTGQSRFEAFAAQLREAGINLETYLAIRRRAVEQSALAELISIPAALVTPKEAEAEFRRANEEAVASAVFFQSTNFLSSVTITPEAVGNHFTNFSANYRIPEKLVVSYIRLPASNHLAAAEAEFAKIPNLAAQLEQAYASRPTNSFVDDQGVVLSKDAALAKLRSDEVRRLAANLAANAATEIYNDLGQINPARPENLEAVAAKRGLRVEITQPFARNERALGLESLQGLAEELQKLTPDAPFTEPLVSLDGAFILAVKTRIPSSLPPLESVRARVTEDYRQQQARLSARTAGQAFHSVATNALASGKSFAAIVAEQKLQAIDLPPFSMASTMVPGLPPFADLNTLKEAAFALEPGKVSTFNISAQGGFVLFLKAKTPVSDDKLKAELPSFVAEVRSRRSTGAAFFDWFTSEWSKSSVARAFTRPADTNAPSGM